MARRSAALAADLGVRRTLTAEWRAKAFLLRFPCVGEVILASIAFETGLKTSFIRSGDNPWALSSTRTGLQIKSGWWPLHRALQEIWPPPLDAVFSSMSCSTTLP